jgi:4-hydroxy-tetrahydrodipicolinate synthase
MREKLKGLYIIMTTPFKEDLELDLEGLRENVRFILENGVNKDAGLLVPLAGVGEGPYLSEEEYFSAVKVILDEAKGKIPIFPGVHLPGTKETIKRCKKLQELEVEGIQLSPPSPYFVPTENEVFYHYKLVAETVKKLGIVVYNTWWERLYDMTAQLIGKLAEIPNIVGIKWSSKELRNFVNVLELYANKLAFFDNQGADTMVLSHSLGAKGIVSFSASFAPWHALKIWKLLQDREYSKVMDELNKWERPYHRFMEDIMKEGKTFTAAHKACVEIAGLKAGPPRLPQTPLTSKQKERLKEIFEKSGILKKPNS